MASVAETLFADDGPRSGRKKKKRGDSRSSKHLDAVSALALGGSADGGGDARAVDAAWQQFTSPDGRTYYYNQITKESRWKLPKALRHKQQQEQNPQEAVAEPAPATETHRARESATRSEATPRSAPERYGRKPEEQQSDDTHAKSAGRGDIVARLQASLAGRINPMASGPPPMVKIPRGIPEASDVGERTRANSTGTDAGGLFSASGVFGSEPAESQYDAETAGMTPAERLRFIRRKRQESMFKKEKIVEEDDFMKEFAMNMKKKEAERAQRMTPEELEREQRETERKKRELEEKKRREERERREQREAEEQAEREKLREREEEERRWREEERKKKEEEEKQREAEELRLREELEREEKRRRKEERKRKEEEEAEKRRVEEEQEKSEIAKKAEDAEKASPTQDVSHKLQSRSRGSSAADVDNVSAAHYDLFHEGANEEENGSARTKRRSRSKGSKTFAADVVASNEARRSRSSSRQESNDFVQPPEEPVGSEIAPPRSRQASTASTEGAQIAAEHVAEQMEKVTIDEDDAEAEAEAERERRERKERRRRRKERERRRQEEDSEDAQQHDTQPVPSPPTSGCQCAACVHHGNVPTSHHHHPPTSQHGQTPPGSYPYYPQHYPPPPFYAPPPTYGYPPPPPFMYAPPPPMMFPPAMIPPPMMATPMMGAPMSGNGMMFNGMPVGSSSAIIVAPEYAQYAPPVLSQCQSCRGRGVGLAEKNGFCAHCNRLRLDFIVASAQIRKRCTSCGGWGLGLVQANGMCAHCTRLASQATAPSTAIGSNIKSNPPPPVEWDASSSENDSDWDE